jgi:glycosyltransferase involved in cell wall biosynthesis
MKSWENSSELPLISISCITYNHGNYIDKALESFLMQETHFPFEILIHDDASTDNTADIIRIYAEKYPTIIKPIYQTENQYSKGSDIVSYNFTRAKGEYIALCEGDDYWTDKKKLQIQVEKMIKHNDCLISFHPSNIVYNQTISSEVTGRHSENDKVFNVREVIKGDGGFCPTASIIIKKDVVDNLPDFFAKAPVGDFFLQVVAANSAGALYIDRTMSAYRIHPSGVWTSKLTNYESLYNAAIGMSKSLKEMDEFYNFHYHQEIIFVLSNLFIGIISNITFNIEDRINTYNICKNIFSSKQRIEIERLIHSYTQPDNEI